MGGGGVLHQLFGKRAPAESVLSFVTKKTNDNFLSKILSCSQCNQQHPPPLHPSSVFVSIPDRVNPDYVLRLMLVQKSHVALCFFPLMTSKHQALVLQNKKLSKSKVTGLSSNMILRQVSVVGKLNKSHSFIL